MVEAAVLLEVVPEGEKLTIEVTNVVPAHEFPAVDDRVAEVALVNGQTGEVLWQEAVTVQADSTTRLSVERPVAEHGFSIELRFYPGPALWPDRYYVLQSLGLP
jgi:hypothetical protein